MVKKAGKGAKLVKVDIKSAFRLLPVHPDDFNLLGMYFGGMYYVDKALPFGLSISCSLFETFSRFVEWCARVATNNPLIIHYLDDFCGCATEESEAQDTLTTILHVFSDIGIPVANEKVEGPSSCLKFLGLVFDTERMQVRIPEDKLRDLKKHRCAISGDRHEKDDSPTVTVPHRKAQLRL